VPGDYFQAECREFESRLPLPANPTDWLESHCSPRRGARCRAERIVMGGEPASCRSHPVRRPRAGHSTANEPGVDARHLAHGAVIHVRLDSRYRKELTQCAQTPLSGGSEYDSEHVPSKLDVASSSLVSRSMAGLFQRELLAAGVSPVLTRAYHRGCRRRCGGKVMPAGCSCEVALRACANR
jgi:hypothetical protein